jgi:hypothetical protein
MWSIYAAVTRATLDGKNPGGWVPEQKLNVTEAIEAYTMGSAYAEFQDKEKGSITPGKLADFVVLSDDIFKIPSAAIKNVKVEATYLGWNRKTLFRFRKDLETNLQTTLHLANGDLGSLEPTRYRNPLPGDPATRATCEYLLYRDGLSDNPRRLRWRLQPPFVPAPKWVPGCWVPRIAKKSLACL